MTKTLSLQVKTNQDGSYSASIPVGELDRIAFVDYYDERHGTGFQRMEVLTTKRAKEIAEYISRCKHADVTWDLFEMTANARLSKRDVTYTASSSDSAVGTLDIPEPNREQWLSLIDGGTRLLGIRQALEESILSKEDRVDVRVFIGLTLAQEISKFLLINDRQKKVRTDLSLRVAQRQLDSGKLKEWEQKELAAVVPESDSWKFVASRWTAHLQEDADSPWQGYVQMPGDIVTRPVKMQALFTSLRPFLNGDYATIQTLDDQLLSAVKNFWTAVKNVNLKAWSEPRTNVLFGSIGASACHDALSRIVATIAHNEDQPDLTVPRFQLLIEDSDVADYSFWYSRRGVKRSKAGPEYPDKAGEASFMTGSSNYQRLARDLEKQWRRKLVKPKVARTREDASPPAEVPA